MQEPRLLQAPGKHCLRASPLTVKKGKRGPEVGPACPGVESQGLWRAAAGSRPSPCPGVESQSLWRAAAGSRPSPISIHCFVLFPLSHAVASAMPSVASAPELSRSPPLSSPSALMVPQPLPALCPTVQSAEDTGPSARDDDTGRVEVVRQWAHFSSVDVAPR